jgi:hypothetical protein
MSQENIIQKYNLKIFYLTIEIQYKNKSLIFMKSRVERKGVVWGKNIGRTHFLSGVEAYEKKNQKCF